MTKYDLNDHERRTYMPAIAVTIEVITSILLWIRIANRFVTNSRLGFDDILIIIAWILGVGVTATVLLATERFGFDRHIWDSPQDDWWKGALIAFVVEVLFFWSTCCTKISVLMFYRRLVVGTYNRKFKFAIWAAIAFVVAYTITFFVIILLECTPVEAQWRQYDYPWIKKHPHFTCTSVDLGVKIGKLVGALSVVTDFYSVMLPAVLIAQIRINKRQRYGLFFIFGIGFLVVGAGVARTIYLFRTFGEVYDKPWSVFNVFLASIIECNIGIVCACAPSLKSLFGKFFSDMTSKYGSKESSNNNSENNSGKRSVFDGSNLSSINDRRFDDRAVKLKRTTSTPRTAQKCYLAPYKPDKEESSFIQTHEHGLDYEEPVAVGYGENLVLPSVRNHSPMPSKLFEETFSLPPPRTPEPGPESYIISPSPSNSSDDEASLVEKSDDESKKIPSRRPDRKDGTNTMPYRPSGSVATSSAGPSASRDPISPYSELSFINEPPQPDPFMPSDNERPRIRRKLSREKWEKQIRFNAI